MAYGVRFETPNGDLQIDSDTTNSGLIVIDSGTGGNISNVNLTTDWVFARPTGSGNTQIALRNTSGNNYSFYAYNNVAISSVEWFIARWANVNTAPAGGYGIVIMNADGDIAFDSNRLTGDGGATITNHRPTFFHPGGRPVDLSTNTMVLTTDRSNFVLMNDTNSVFTNSTTFDYLGYHWQNSAGSSTLQGIHWVGYSESVLMTQFGNFPQNFSIGSPETFFAEGGSV